MLKLLAAAGSLVLALPLALVPSAGADQDDVVFEWQEPADDGLEVEGTAVPIRARADFPEGVDRWQVDVLAPDNSGEGGTDFGTVCDGDGDGGSSVRVRCRWDTTTSADGAIAPNQIYRIVVTAWPETPEADTEGDPEAEAEPEADGAGGEEAERPDEPAEAATEPEPRTGPERTVTVANPPRPVENVQLHYHPERSVVTVTWAPNPEPDITGYLVEERFGSGDWSLVAQPTTLYWSGHLSQEGTYRYRVAAVRHAGSPGRVKPGPFRQPQSGMRKVEHQPREEPSSQAAGTSTSTTTTTIATGPPSRSGSEGGRSKARGDAGQGARPGGQPDRAQSGRPAPATTSSTVPSSAGEPGPVGSVIVTYENRGDPGSPAVPDTSAAPGTDGSRPLVSPIQPGDPGSVETRYGDPLDLPAPLTPEEAFDPGFAYELPYPSEALLGGSSAAPPRILGSVALFETRQDQQRAMLAALAGGLCLFVLAMQFVVLIHRPRPTELLPASTDWD